MKIYTVWVSVMVLQHCSAWTIKRHPRPSRRQFQQLFLSTKSQNINGRSENFPYQSVMAPMVAASDFPFRCLCRQHGVDLAFTQMLHSRNLVHDKKFRQTHLDLWEYSDFSKKPLLPQQSQFLEGSNPAIDSLPIDFCKGPLIVQLAGHKVESVLEAAALVMEESQGQMTGIDLNLGCPQKIASKGNYGAFLMESDFDCVCDILTALSGWMQQQYPKTKVSAKIRLPLTDDMLVKERIPRLLATGISFLTIHGRTLYENKTKVRECHVDRIKLAIETAQKIKSDFPVVANGGVEAFSDVRLVQQETGAVAVMSSEALLETPNVFSPLYESERQTARQRLNQQFGFAHDYLDWCSVFPPLPGVLGGQGSFNIARGHLFKFLHRYLQEHPDLRDNLGSPKLSTLVDARSLVNELQARYDPLSDEELEECTSARPSSSWYRRHRQSLENGLVHTRQVGGATSNGTEEDISTMSIEEKKAMLRKRISKLKEQRLMKN